MDNIFQGIGVLRGEVIQEMCEEKERFFVSIKTPNSTKKYQLFFTPRYRRSLWALKEQIKNNGNSQRLIVYPKILHLPGRDKPHQIRFQLVGFDNGSNSGVAELADFEFKLAGKWQFIAVCKTPVISIHRNLSEPQLEHYKSLEPAKRKQYASASHVPLLWRDAPVPPFRFNPKLEKDKQGETFFVKIKAKFLPDKDLFGFDSLTGVPTTELPKFIKFKDKTRLQKPGSKKPSASKPKPKSKQINKELKLKKKPDNKEVSVD